LWNAPSGRIIYQFAPDASFSEDVLYSASMNDTVKKFIKNQAALSSLYSSPNTGVYGIFPTAGIFWARVWRTRRFPTGLRNASYKFEMAC
jgi:hypothetical protein